MQLCLFKYQKLSICHYEDFQKGSFMMKEAFKLLIIIFFFVRLNAENSSAQTSVKEKIIFASSRDTTQLPNFSLYVMDTDGSNVTRLVDTLIGYRPRVSKDNKKIAYIGRYSEKYIGPPQIRVMNIDGSDDHVVSLWEIRPGEWEPVFSGGFDPVWSPDGIYVAYDRCDNCELGGGNFEIFIVKSDTLSGFYESRVTNSIYAEYIFDWSPDGKRLLFRAQYFNNNYDFDGELFTMNVDGTDWYQLTDDSLSIVDARYSPTGDTIAYIGDKQGQSDIYLLNIKNYKTEIIPVSITGYYGHTIDWSDNGKRIVFDSDHQIYILNIEDKTVTQITADNYLNGAAEFFLATITSVADEYTQSQSDVCFINVYPNPLNSTANVNYTVNKDSYVKLYLYNILGEQADELVDRYQRKGEYVLKFDQSKLSSGIYFLVLTIDGLVTAGKKIILMK